MADHEPGSDERIGAYRVLGLLGRGGMGEVFLAWDDRLKRKVAIKRLRRDSEIHPSLRQRLLREARAVAGLNHPAIVQVYDLLEDPSGDCLVLEYAEGKTLATFLAGGLLEPPLAVRLAREIADGLAAAHAAEIVHRDLKPENVIVTPSGHAKILDFGLARMHAADDSLHTQQGALLGTYHTMSPEQANGGEADERSDLFSLGVVLYEMFTGRSPFRGAHPLETLKRVTTEDPPRVDTVRPGLPPRLGTLIERLLAKEPSRRPAGAAKVVRELESIEATFSSPRLPVVESVSDLPTNVLEIRPDDLQKAIPRSPDAPASTAGMTVLARRRYGKVAAVALLPVAALGAVLLLLNRPPEPEKPLPVEPPRLLRVVVPRPEVASEDERLELVASGTLIASLNALGSLEGVAAIDPLQLVGKPKSAVEMARAAAADEVLAIRLESMGSLGRITIRRIHGAEGKVLWTDAFDAPIETGDLRLLADMVASHLRRGYPGKQPKPGTLTLDVRGEDYAEFLEIKQRDEAGRAPRQNELPDLEKLIQTSPRFLEARLLAADILHAIFQSTRQISDRERALTFIREAELLAPEDPRPLLRRLRIELSEAQTDVAAATLARLENLLPGDPQLVIYRARLAQREGRTEEALAGLRTAAARSSSWKILNELARLESQTGRVEYARRRWRKILETSSDNLWALENLASLELLFGDPKRAEQFYRNLIPRAPQRNFFTNLGVALFLQGRSEDAIPIFHQALEIDPDHVYTTLNLADAELALGREREAKTHYRVVLRGLEKNSLETELSSIDVMVKAQCLAHLGRTREAVETTQQALRKNPDDPELLQYAAVVYTTVGDRASALVSVQRALQGGVQPRWFSVPAFASLKSDPEFRVMLRKAVEAKP